MNPTNKKLLLLICCLVALNACSTDDDTHGNPLVASGSAAVSGSGAAGSAGESGTAGSAGSAAGIGTSGTGASGTGVSGAGGDAGHGVSGDVLYKHISVQSLGGCVLAADHHATCWNGYDDPYKNEQPAPTYESLALASLGTFCALGEDAVTRCHYDGGEITLAGANDWTDIIALSNTAICGIGSAGALTCSPAAGTELGASPLAKASFISIDGASPVLCGVQQDGGVACGTPGAPGTPMAVPVLTDAKQVSVGDGAACALRAAGDVTCWSIVGGTQAPTVTGKYIQIAVGNEGYVCGIRTDGTLGCEGPQADGTRQPSLGTFVALAAYGAGGCGIRKDGQVDCWGDVPDPQDPVVADTL